MVNRTRVEGGGYSKHDIITQYAEFGRSEKTTPLKVSTYTLRVE